MYTSQLTGAEIDNALILARSIGQNNGVPLGRGNGTVQFRRLDTTLSQASTGIPESAAVWEALNNRISAYLVFRGTVPTASDLPEGSAVGDAYHIADTDSNVAWDGVQWSDVGRIGVFDLTPEDIGAARADQTVFTVNGVAPEMGNVQLSAEDLGLLDMVYPIGSIYMSMVDVSPASFLGGSWARIENVFLLASSQDHPVTNDAQDGGSETVTLTVEQMPAHTHAVKFNVQDQSGGTGARRLNSDGSNQVSSGSAGGNKPHDNMPPYKAVYMWQRQE